MSRCDIVFIGYENLENLGLRSIISYLYSRNIKADLLPFRPGQNQYILRILKRTNPKIVGFSLIFQYTLNEFNVLIKYLRKHSVKSHFTAGGHFPSVEPEKTFELVPDLDSIVRFEGELTIEDLYNNLSNKDRWKEIAGIAFKSISGVIINKNRPLIKDLDKIPLLKRDTHFQCITGINLASMLSSRGCLNNCSFCSIRLFYGSAGGPLRRTRSPQLVIKEMSDLFVNSKVRYFLFQDDDFANRSTSQKRWISTFLDEIEKQNLNNKIHWKISCRVDDIDKTTFLRMKNHGLSFVYLGIESGNEKGLKTLNKGVTVDQNLTAINILKELGVGIFIGFMLFDPSTTCQTLAENLQFMKVIGADGYFPLDFCKMLPYAGTLIEKDLKQSNRLTGTMVAPDYNFTDPKIDLYFYFVQKIFSYRNFNPEGIVNKLSKTAFEFRLVCDFYPGCDMTEFQKELNMLTLRSNMEAIEVLEKLLDIVDISDSENITEKTDKVLDLAESEWKTEFEVDADLRKLKNKYLSLLDQTKIL
jgi:anaerobic magnesium-protoporphyrin IX monomethyl ester cyclase